MNPQKLKDLQALILKAAKFNALPLDGRSLERLDPVLVGQPDLMGTPKSLTLCPGMSGMMVNTFTSVRTARAQSRPT